MYWHVGRPRVCLDVVSDGAEKLTSASARLGFTARAHGLREPAKLEAASVEAELYRVKGAERRSRQPLEACTYRQRGRRTLQQHCSISQSILQFGVDKAQQLDPPVHTCASGHVIPASRTALQAPQPTSRKAANSNVGGKANPRNQKPKDREGQSERKKKCPHAMRPPQPPETKAGRVNFGRAMVSALGTLVRAWRAGGMAARPA